MSARPTKDAVREKNAETRLSRNKVIRWFQQYWYYYKLPVLLGSFIFIWVVIVTVALINTERPDMFLVTMAMHPIPDDEYEELVERVAEYAEDFNKDGKIIIHPQNMLMELSENAPFFEETVNQFWRVVSEEEKVFYIVDDTLYQLLMYAEALAPLEEFGIESEEPYRLPINGTPLLEGLNFDTRGEFYIVLRCWIEENRNNKNLAARYDMAVSMIRKAVISQGS